MAEGAHDPDNENNEGEDGKRDVEPGKSAGWKMKEVKCVAEDGEKNEQKAKPNRGVAAH